MSTPASITDLPPDVTRVLQPLLDRAVETLSARLLKRFSFACCWIPANANGFSLRRNRSLAPLV
jgi:hypothetical protein